jgi:hypothetical protein
LEDAQAKFLLFRPISHSPNFSEQSTVLLGRHDRGFVVDSNELYADYEVERNMPFKVFDRFEQPRSYFGVTAPLARDFP